MLRSKAQLMAVSRHLPHCFPLFHSVFLSELLPLSFPSCGRLHTSSSSCSLYSLPPCGRPISLCAHLSLPILRTSTLFYFGPSFFRNHPSHENRTHFPPWKLYIPGLRTIYNERIIRRWSLTFRVLYVSPRSLDSAVGSDWRRAGRWKGRSSSPGRVKNFLHVIQTCSGAHPAPCPVGAGGKAAGVWSWPPTSS
jgi:hypothetical protein